MLLVLATRNRKKRGEIVEILDNLPLELGDLYAVSRRSRGRGGRRHVRGQRPQEGVGGGASGQAMGRSARTAAWWCRPSMVGPASTRRATPASRATTRPTTICFSRSWPRLSKDKRCGGYYVCTAALADPAGRDSSGRRGPLSWRHHRRAPRRRRLRLRSSLPDPGVPPHLRRAEPCVKHALSHRARALAQLRPILRKLAKRSARRAGS